MPCLWKIDIVQIMDDKLLEELYASYQGDAYAAHLRSVVEEYGDLETAKMIIDQFENSQNGNNSTTVVEFQINRHSFWPKVKREFDKLVCGDSTYEKENEEYYVLGKFYSLATASAMASSISQITNIPVYILTPTIALMLHSLFKIGRNAYCSMV